MKKINIPALLLALVVVSMFIGVGLAIAMRNIWLIVLFIVLGFAIMGFGIANKKKKSGSQA
ncbi:DUF5325 family protein [Ornithinibacillus sp. BX22]|uniref:DUF5325 family protein n=2 Tax=Ornithinibacillus TaxID=484508 RepID=A0A923L3M4_9BACI|nr:MULTISPECIES: DUF5325 family protein [Ornithinibacillus]MBC5635831.1 DUF5325 family protein [Ornithinibacillus hominis]MBS3680180.1 DUF5325 family protein [Ornithinibacillus massiliensis]